MKQFVINRNSWHYRLNQKFMNEYGFSKSLMEDKWEPRHNDFCSYWRATIFRIVFLGILLYTFSMFVFIFAQHTMDVVWGITAFIVLIGIPVLVVWCYEKYKSRNKSREDKPESLFIQKYQAHKSKICPMVEYKE